MTLNTSIPVQVSLVDPPEDILCLFELGVITEADPLSDSVVSQGDKGTDVLDTLGELKSESSGELLIRLEPGIQHHGVHLAGYLKFKRITRGQRGDLHLIITYFVLIAGVV